MVQAHDTGPNGVTVDELIRQLTPFVDSLLRQIDGEEFTTNEFIDIMQQVPQSRIAYERALTEWGEASRQAKMVIHGQVIPAILRHSDYVEWLGFAHDQADEYSVPGWWRLVPEAGRE